MKRYALLLTTALIVLLGGMSAASAKAPNERAEQRDQRDQHRDQRQERRKDRTEARKERAEQRRERRRQRIAALSARFGGMLRQPAVHAELELHARRMAKLKALRSVAEREGKAALLPRIDKLTQKEQARHERRMAALTTDAGRAQ